jgi:serine/threonine-protein kinase
VPPERAIYLLRQACDSLAEAHAHGLVHRDVKPSNLFVCRMGLAVDFVKVLDFGLVVADRRAGDDETRLTAAGGATGTPAYMAPEMVTDPTLVGPATDVYALGCVAFWLLTGQTLFGAPSPMLVMLSHLQAPPRPPSGAAPRPVPPELDALVLACLAKRAEDRPSDAAELGRRLAACPVSESWTEERARAWWSARATGPGDG